MARLLTSGAEWNDATAEGITLGAGTTITTTNPRSGTYCYTGNSSTDARFLLTAVLGTTYFLRSYHYFQDFATAAATPVVLAFDATTPAAMARLLITDTGLIQLVQGSGQTLVATSASPVALNTYVRMELSLNIGTGSVDAVEGLVNGVSIGSASGLNISDVLTWRANVSLPLVASGTCYVDDVALNNSSGASQNSWPGSAKIVLLRPISLNTNGGSWTDDNAATTSAALTNAVDNTPPKGIADTAAGGGDHQVRNAAANTSLDMNLTTYSTAGINATDTINVLEPQIAVGAPVVTAAKTGSYGVVSNPAITNRVFTGGGTAAANFWRGSAAAAYPSGWGWERGTVTYGSSVTVGTSPVARVTITGGTVTRIADVAAIGMYVDYTPATTKAPPFQARTARNTLLRR